MTRRRLGHEARIAAIALAGGVPALAFALGWVWLTDASAKLRFTVSLLSLGSWAVAAVLVRDEVARALQTLGNLVAALREGDYSIRGRGRAGDDALSFAMREINAFADTLRETRLGDLEVAALLAQVTSVVDVAMIAVDDAGIVRVANRAAEALLGVPSPRIVGERAEALGLQPLLEGETPRRVQGVFSGATGEWQLRRSTFRQRGRPHTLLVLTDLSRALREEERAAWQRLVRVLGHEINNSLAPIHSLAQSLQQVQRSGAPDANEDVARGLAVIERRAASLNRFMSAYTRLAKLPPPRFDVVEVGAWVRRIAELEKRLTVEVRAGPPAEVRGDADQLDQVLINLVRNAVDAASEESGGVRVSWRVAEDEVTVTVEDDGPGILDASNLFVPFFTTKPEGSGIGLALSRQIVEAHGGSVRLSNRAGTHGCEAVVVLPRRPHPSPLPAGEGVPSPLGRGSG